MQKMRMYYLDVPRGAADRRLTSDEWRGFCAYPTRWLARARELEEGYDQVVDGLWISGMAEQLTHGGWLLSLGPMVYEVQLPVHVHVAGSDDWLEPGAPLALGFRILPVIKNGHCPRRVTVSLGDVFAQRQDERGRTTFDFRTFVLHQG